MVLLSVKERLTLKPSRLVLHLGDLKLRYVNFWGQRCLGWLHARFSLLCSLGRGDWRSLELVLTLTTGA